jgi:hypothetical protein
MAPPKMSRQDGGCILADALPAALGAFVSPLTVLLAVGSPPWLGLLPSWLWLATSSTRLRGLLALATGVPDHTEVPLCERLCRRRDGGGVRAQARWPYRAGGGRPITLAMCVLHSSNHIREDRRPLVSSGNKCGQ